MLGYKMAGGRALGELPGIRFKRTPACLSGRPPAAGNSRLERCGPIGRKQQCLRSAAGDVSAASAAVKFPSSPLSPAPRRPLSRQDPQLTQRPCPAEARSRSP
ncbi:hypothetical protein COCON_G00126720 [Conger conger]|uniref:Uncharacterized protein n=1 Tax=Conger conger TaxID=82655 RepID=A0A9Q1DDX0_CONCO|nr:hypothetical protein COCON_G00126720 [Conger conger]